MDLFLRIAVVALLVIYLTESPDRLTLNEPAPWTQEMLERWHNSVVRGGDDWWQIQFLYSYFTHMGLVSQEEYNKFKGFHWDHIYRRACGRPDTYPQDLYFGRREYHPKP